jgi:hypothetical protein
VDSGSTLLKWRIYTASRIPESIRPAGIRIAVKLVADKKLSLDQFGSFLIDAEIQPKEIPERSLLRGYDVADFGLISGLSGCGYTAEEKKLLSTNWSSKMNEHGLFLNLNDAKQFTRIANERVSEHAPFWVFILYSLV